MHEGAAAEWFLSLFLLPERACAVVGDLREAHRFSWVTVLRVAASGLMADYRRAGLRLVLLGIQALVLELGSLDLALHIDLPQRWHSGDVFCFLALVLVGVWTANGAPARELAACLSLAAINGIFVAAMMNLTANLRIGPGFAFAEVALLAGAVLVRRRRLAFV